MSAPDLAVSTWSIHRALGISYPHAPGDDSPARAEPTWGAGTLSLMQAPDALKAFGLDRIEICSFHIPAHDRGFQAELRGALRDAGVKLQTLLIDDGDITDPVNRRRDIDWIGRWIDVAAELGAERARVIGGKQKPSPEAIDLSVAGLGELARRGADQGVRIITENWFDTLGGPDVVNAVLGRLDGMVGFLADFGNWKGPGKYDALAAVIGRAEDTHAKCHFEPGLRMDTADYGRCLSIAAAAGYSGPHTLIYEGADDDEWEALRMERDFVLAHRAAATVAA
ncbi:MAG TPA: TIM barrel protein [Bauldia sp.]|nr:TIM barrel protein [Bauldia sp.]